MKIEDVKKDLGDDANLFDYEEKDGVVAAKLKNFLKPNEFREVAERVKGLGGVYVPKDKGGPYFTFKGKTTSSEKSEVATSDKKDNLLKDLWAYADDVEKKMGIIKEKLRLLGYKGN